MDAAFGVDDVVVDGALEDAMEGEVGSNHDMIRSGIRIIDRIGSEEMTPYPNTHTEY